MELSDHSPNTWKTLKQIWVSFSFFGGGRHFDLAQWAPKEQQETVRERRVTRDYLGVTVTVQEGMIRFSTKAVSVEWGRALELGEIPETKLTQKDLSTDLAVQGSRGWGGYKVARVQSLAVSHKHVGYSSLLNLPASVTWITKWEYHCLPHGAVGRIRWSCR